MDIITNNRVSGINTSVPEKNVKINSRDGGQSEIEDRVEIGYSRSKPEKDVTFLYYINGHYADLEPYMAPVMLGLEKAGSDKNINMVAQFGRAPQELAHPDGSKTNIDGDWSGIRRYYIEKNPKSPYIEPKSPVYAADDTHTAEGEKYFSKSSKVDMFSPEVLRDFIAWGMSEYPAKHYVVAIMGHGGSWQGSTMPPSLVADSIKDGVSMSNKKTGRHDHTDVLMYNACLMGNVEATNEIKDVVDYTLGSEAVAYTSAFDEWPNLLKQVKEDLNSGKGFDARKFSVDSVEHFREIGDPNMNNPYNTLSAIDNKKVGGLVDSLGNFVKDWKESGVPDTVLFDDIKKSKGFLYPFEDETSYIGLFCGAMKDIGSIAKTVIDDTRVTDKLKEDSKNILKALGEAVIDEQHAGPGGDGATGLTIWGPVHTKLINANKSYYKYAVPDFQKTGWGNMLEEFAQNHDVGGDLPKAGEQIEAVKHFEEANR